jgi:hypothetical protein
MGVGDQTRWQPHQAPSQARPATFGQRCNKSCIPVESLYRDAFVFTTNQLDPLPAQPSQHPLRKKRKRTDAQHADAFLVILDAATPPSHAMN